MDGFRLRGSYYGDGVPSPSDLQHADGRARMRELIHEMLKTAEANGASTTFVDRLRQDLALLDDE